MGRGVRFAVHGTPFVITCRETQLDVEYHRRFAVIFVIHWLKLLFMWMGFGPEIHCGKHEFSSFVF